MNYLEDSDSDHEEGRPEFSHLNLFVPKCSNEKEGKSALIQTWKAISPPVKEEDKVGNWFATVYKTKKETVLYVGKVLKRFLIDKDGSVQSLELDCLANAYRKDAKALHEPQNNERDVENFAVENIIAGPLNGV